MNGARDKKQDINAHTINSFNQLLVLVYKKANDKKPEMRTVHSHAKELTRQSSCIDHGGVRASKTRGASARYGISFFIKIGAGLLAINPAERFNQLRYNYA